MDERLFSRRLAFEHTSGDLLYPVRVHSRASGQDRFRVWDRVQSQELEVEEDEMLRLVLEHNHAVRMRTLNGSRHGGYRATGSSIIAVHHFDETPAPVESPLSDDAETSEATLDAPVGAHTTERSEQAAADHAGDDEDRESGFSITSPSLGELREARLREGTVRYFERGDGEPLLFVHGLLANADAWRDVIPTLSASYRCIAPDWPLGAHHPAMGAHTDLSPNGMARLMLAFLDHLGIERVTLVGRGIGVTYCRLAASLAPARIERVVIAAGPAPSLPSATTRPLMLLARAPRAMVLLAYLLQLSIVQRAVTRLADGHPGDPQPPSFRPLRHDPRVRRDLRKILRGLSATPALRSAANTPAVLTVTGLGALQLSPAGEDRVLDQSMTSSSSAERRRERSENTDEVVLTQECASHGDQIGQGHG